jgi:ubiquitin-conjugating enzyme E2 J2
MASEICVRRLTKELKAIAKDETLRRDPRIVVAPNESNILEMHYVIEGSKGSPYEGGVYHGKLLFPKEYPLKPPGVMMYTPSGRFHTGRRLCLSMSDFHPETWNPMWSVSTILTGLYSFMLETNPTLGSIETTTQKKRQLAAESLAYNVKNSKDFCKLFPDYVERHRIEEEQRQQKRRQSSLRSSASAKGDGSTAALSVGPRGGENNHHHRRPMVELRLLGGGAGVAAVVVAVLSLAVVYFRFL